MKHALLVLALSLLGGSVGAEEWLIVLNKSDNTASILDAKTGARGRRCLSARDRMRSSAFGWDNGGRVQLRGIGKSRADVDADRSRERAPIATIEFPRGRGLMA